MVNPGSDSVRLVRLSLRRGETIAEARLIEGVEVYFCAKDHCPHYQGQLGLLPDTATMHCALVHYPPDRTCQPFYLEAAEHLDQAARHQTWEDRLDEAEAFEKSLAGASPSPARGECVWERGPGGAGPGKPLRR